MKILGIDPGGTTGAALIEWDMKFPITSLNAPVLDSWQLPFDEVAPWANGLIGHVDHIAMERFIISPRTVKNTRQYEALYVIGGVGFLCQVKPTQIIGVTPVIHMQQASVAKNAWPNERLRMLGFWPMVKGNHARDALRHALLCCHTLSKS